MLDLLGGEVTYHLLDLVLFGEFHTQDGLLGGDYEMVVDTYFLSRDGHLDDVALHVLPEVHAGCDLLVVSYGGLTQEPHFHGQVTFGLVTLVCASETASSEILQVAVILPHLAMVALQRLAYLVELVRQVLSSLTFCISTVDFETKFLPEIIYDIVVEMYLQ